jgi:hypothetical protein
MYVCMRAYVCTYVCVCMYVRTYVCMHACMCVCMYICAYTLQIHTHTIHTHVLVRILYVLALRSLRFAANLPPQEHDVALHLPPLRLRVIALHSVLRTEQIIKSGKRCAFSCSVIPALRFWFTKPIQLHHRSVQRE